LAKTIPATNTTGNESSASKPAPHEPLPTTANCSHKGNQFNLFEVFSSKDVDNLFAAANTSKSDAEPFCECGSGDCEGGGGKDGVEACTRELEKYKTFQVFWQAGK
jgi:hypothetical protein